MKTYSIFICLVTALVACKKDKTDEPVDSGANDNTTPVITLSSPLDNAVYFNTDTVLITGTVTDNELHECSIEIKDDTTNQVYFTANPYVHGLSAANINYSYIVNVVKDSKVTMTMSAQDHHPNMAVKIIHMTFKP